MCLATFNRPFASKRLFSFPFPIICTIELLQFGCFLCLRLNSLVPSFVNLFYKTKTKIVFTFRLHVNFPNKIGFRFVYYFLIFRAKHKHPESSAYTHARTHSHTTTNAFNPTQSNMLLWQVDLRLFFCAQWQ